MIGQQLEMEIFMDWVDGVPPELTGQDRVWIVAEIPSLFGNLYSRYECFLWLDGKGWTPKEVLRALRWKLLEI